jgi:hypothetical protein
MRGQQADGEQLGDPEQRHRRTERRREQRVREGARIRANSNLAAAVLVLQIPVKIGYALWDPVTRNSERFCRDRGFDTELVPLRVG